MKKGSRLKTTSSMVIACIILIAIWALFFCCSVPTLATEYYVPQINFAEKKVPIAKYHWHFDRIDGCIYKEPGIPNSYYVWTKLQVQSWRNALREYTGNHDSWTITGRYINNVAALQSCPLKFYILKSYKEFPGYPQQTGSYTSVDYNQNGELDTARVYLAPTVLHADGKTEVNLPQYAFRNSARHEIGHVLGLAHTLTEKGYLMSPRFDFWEQKDQLPITTLELSTLVQIYGKNGWH